MIIIQPSASRTTNRRAPIPAINRWAIFNRPLTRTQWNRLFGPSRLEGIRHLSDRHFPFSLFDGLDQNPLTYDWDERALGRQPRGPLARSK
jgi:hypothetical protein